MARHRVYKLVRETKTKVLNVSTSLILVAMSLGGALPALITNTAHAAGAITVQPYSLQGWSPYTTGNGSVHFIQDVSAPLGRSSLQLTTSNNNSDRASLQLPTATPLKNISQLSYETKQLAPTSAEGDAAYRLTIDADGNIATTGDSATLVYEPYWQNNGNPDPAPVVNGVWQTWDVAQGYFWASIPSGNTIAGLTNGAGGPPFYTLSQLKTLLPNALVTGVSTGIGSYNLNYNIEVDNLNFDGNIYDFATPPTPAQTAQVVTPADLSFLGGWYYFNDNTNVPSITGSNTSDIIANPSAQTGDNGAVRLDASNGGRPALATLKYNGTLLSNISQLGFSTYQPSSNGGPTTESDFFNFDVNFGTGLTGYQGRLVYVPSVNGSVKQNQWQNWEAVSSNGLWTWSHYYKNGSKWPDGNTSEYRTWDDIVANFPGAGIAGQTLVRAGNPDNYTYVGYTDHVYLATYQNGSNVNYNFEAVPPAAPINLGFTQGTKTLACGSALNSSTGIYSTHLHWSIPNGQTETEWLVTPTYPSGSHGTPYSWTSGTDVWIGANIGQGYGAAPHDQGTYTYSVQYKGANGLWSDPATCSLVYDTTAPNGTVSYTGGNSVNGVIYLQSIDGLQYHDTLTDNVNLGHTAYAVWKTNNSFSNSAKTLFCGNWNNSTTTILVSGTSATVNGNVKDCTAGGSWPDGYYLISHVVYDAAGNLSYFSSEPYPGQRFVIDNTAPAVPTNLSWLDSNNHPATNGYTNVQKGTLSWQDSDSSIDHYVYKFWTNIPGYFDGEANAWSTDPGNADLITKTSTGGSIWTDFYNKEGTYYFCVEAVDYAGNTSACSATFTITYDSTPPTITDSYFPNFTVNMFTNEKQTLQPTVTDANGPLTYLWAVYDQSGKLDQKLLQGNPSQPLNGTSLQIGSAPKGNYTVTLTVTDPAGNSTTKTYNVTISTPANTNSLAPQGIVGGRGGGNSGNNAGNTGTTPQVLGAETAAPDTTTTAGTNTDSSSGQVKGDNTVKIENSASKQSGNFLGLGWWWVPVVIAVLALLLFAVTRRSDSDQA